MTSKSNNNNNNIDVRIIGDVFAEVRVEKEIDFHDDVCGSDETFRTTSYPSLVVLNVRVRDCDSKEIYEMKGDEIIMKKEYNTSITKKSDDNKVLRVSLASSKKKKIMSIISARYVIYLTDGYLILPQTLLNATKTSITIKSLHNDITSIENVPSDAHISKQHSRSAKISTSNLRSDILIKVAASSSNSSSCRNIARSGNLLLLDATKFDDKTNTSKGQEVVMIATQRFSKAYSHDASSLIRTMKCMTRMFDSSSTLFNMHLEGLGSLYPKQSTLLSNDVLDRADAWIDRFCSNLVEKSNAKHITTSQFLSEMFARTTRSASHQGSHHNNSRAPLHILLLFSEKDHVNDDVFRLLENRLRHASHVKQQCLCIHPFGLGEGTESIVKRLLCINGGRGVVMTEKGIHYDQCFFGPGSLPMLLKEKRSDKSIVLKSTRDVLLTMRDGMMRTPHFGSKICFEDYDDTDPEMDKIPEIIDSDVLHKLYSLERARLTESSLFWPCPPGDVNELKEHASKLRRHAKLLKHAMSLVSQDGAKVGDVRWIESVLEKKERSDDSIIVKKTKKKKKIFEDEKIEDEVIPPIPSVQKGGGGGGSFLMNLFGFGGSSSSSSSSDDDVKKKITPSVVENTNTLLPPPIPVETSSTKSEHVNTRAVLLQRSDGSWTWSPELESLVGKHEDAFEKNDNWKGCRPLYWPTALMLMFLKKNQKMNGLHESEAKLWIRSMEKAECWLKKKINGDYDRDG